MKLLTLIILCLTCFSLSAQNMSTDKDLYDFVLDVGFITTINFEDSLLNNISVNEDVIREKYPQFVDSENKIDYKRLLVALYGAFAYIENQNKILLYQLKNLKIDIENINIVNENKFDAIEYKLDRLEKEIAP